MTQQSHWDNFNWPNIISEAKERLREAREHPTKLTPEKDTLEYWCAWAAHQNAVESVTAGETGQGSKEG